MITTTQKPLDAIHDQFEVDISSWLRSNRWLVPPAATYHEIWPREYQNAIGRLTDATSLAIRTRADRAAIRPQSGTSVLFEAKTIQKGHQNLAVEAIPLIIHGIESRLGVICIYPCRRLGDGREFGFEVRPILPQVSRLMIPLNTPPHVRQLIDDNRRVFPNAQITRLTKPTRGSGDAFCIIPADKLNSMPHWEICFGKYS